MGSNNNNIIIGTLNKYFSENSINDILIFLNKINSLGVNKIDTAPTYDNGKIQKKLGTIISDLSHYEICTKVFDDVNNSGKKGLGSDNIFNSVQFSLQTLRCKKLDKLLMHNFDPSIDLLNLAETIDKLFNQNLIKKIGFCKWKINQAIELMSHLQLDSSFYFAQYPYSILNQKFKKELELFKELNIQTEVYGVLAQGTLLGKNNIRDSLSNQSIKHHLNDQSAITKSQELIERFKTNKKVAKWLLSDMLSNEYVDQVLLGFSSMDQILDLL